jgi:hypothetical protein
MRRIDLVVGAKGSPLQLVLAGVFHADTPTGNIPLDEVARCPSPLSCEKSISQPIRQNKS